jgi:hypothetical protein
MSYPDQGPAGRNAPPPGQPMQHAPASWPQHGHTAQPPAYGAGPPYGTPIPAYGTAALGGYRARRRPGVVTVAAVMAFVIGGVVILINLFVLLFLLDILDISHFATDAWKVGEGVFALVRLALGALFIWGGIAALKGSTRTVLLVVSVIEAIFSLLLLPIGVLTIMAAGIGFIIIFFAFLELIFVGTILILIVQPASRDFFRARGKTAN